MDEGDSTRTCVDELVATWDRLRDAIQHACLPYSVNLERLGLTSTHERELQHATLFQPVFDYRKGAAGTGTIGGVFSPGPGRRVSARRKTWCSRCWTSRRGTRCRLEPSHHQVATWPDFRPVYVRNLGMLYSSRKARRCARGRAVSAASPRR